MDVGNYLQNIGLLLLFVVPTVAQKPIAKIEKLPVKGTKNSNETNRILLTMVIAALVVAVVLAAIFMLSLIIQDNTALV